MAGAHSSSLSQSTTTNHHLHKRLQKRIQYLAQIEQTDPLNKDGLDLSILNPLLDTLRLLNTPPPKEKKVRRDNGRVVCISDGLGFFLLELKHKNTAFVNSFDPEPCPKGCIPEIAEGGFLVSAGLFSLGSEAYIVAGYTFPCSELDQGRTRSELLDHLYVTNPSIGSPSLKTYRLSLVNGVPSLSTCDIIKELNTPKFGCIVEKIGNNIHVIDHVHTHEVLDTSHLSRGWIELSSPHHHHHQQQQTCCRWFHLAIGDRIYTAEENSSEHFEVFDTRVNKWEIHEFRPSHCPSVYCIKLVSELLRHGFGRCIGKFAHGKAKNPLYVVIAVGRPCDPNGASSLLSASATIFGRVSGNILCIKIVVSGSR